MGSTSVVKNVLESKAGQAFERAFQEVAAAPGTGEEAKDVQEIDLDKVSVECLCMTNQQILLAMEMDHVKKTVRNWNLYYHSKNKEFEASDQNRPTPVCNATLKPNASIRKLKGAKLMGWRCGSGSSSRKSF